MGIEEAIRNYHSGYDDKLKGILFFELATSIGNLIGEPSRIDAFHMEVIPSRGFLRTAYEIKTSRSDFQSEVRNPMKRKAALRVSNMFFFVTPKHLVKPEEIPPDCGLLELHGESLRQIVAAPFRDGEPSSWTFLASIGRRAMKAEAVKETK